MLKFSQVLSEAKRVGSCKNCGDPKHPRGNIFHLQKTDMFELDNFRNHPLPKTEWSKICNNCHYPHAFTPKLSAKRKERNAFIQKLMDES